MVKIIESASDADGESFVELEVLSKPSAPDVIWGIVKFDDRRRNRSPHAHHFAGMPVADAHNEALKRADEWGVAFVWINDPKNLFPPPVRPK
jgi:hypothetical protein